MTGGIAVAKISTMRAFATEFPIVSLDNRAAFVTQVALWLRGIADSDVLRYAADGGLERETVFLESPRGEKLHLREIPQESGFEAIGFRHDLPDNKGRVWRTEAVVHRLSESDSQGLIRLRTQCIARDAGASLDVPRKPFILKAILGDGWGGQDGLLKVTDQPLWLNDNELSLDIAQRIFLGTASRHLPVIYVSARRANSWLLSQQELERLSYELGGVAHIVVEPSRAFSFKLSNQCNDANPYGGAMGIAVPTRGLVRRIQTNWRLRSGADLIAAIKMSSIAIRSEMPSEGWDWTEIQEQALKRQRQRDRNRLSAEENERLYLEEIENLRDRVRQLEDQISARQQQNVDNSDIDSLLPEALIGRVGSEIYPGEFSDRLRMAAKITCAAADQFGIDKRSVAVLEGIVKSLPLSSSLGELREGLSRATKERKRIASELISLLERHGYRMKSENGHVKMEARVGFSGLDTITLPKTPSESRGFQNLRKQIERTMGIAKLLD